MTTFKACRKVLDTEPPVRLAIITCNVDWTRIKRKMLGTKGRERALQRSQSSYSVLRDV